MNVSWVAVVALIVSLGIDTLVVSVSLGLRRQDQRWRVALTFAGAEAVMPLVGLLIGRVVHPWLGSGTGVIGGIVLLLVAAWFLFFDHDDDDEVASGLGGLALLVAALGVSVDELAAGLSVGVLGVPPLLTSVLIALQAFVFTWVGLTFGAKLRRFTGEWAEKAPGVALAALGVWTLWEALR